MKHSTSVVYRSYLLRRKMLHDAMERERGRAEEICFIIRKRNLSSVGHVATIVLEENDGMTLMLQLDNLEKKTVKF